VSCLDILRWPDPRLTEVCAPVTDVESVAALVGDMFETMYAAPGRGLAAPQVGQMLRLFVMDAGWKAGEMTPLVCVNPTVSAVGAGVAAGAEGCLSMPGVEAQVSRPEVVDLTYTDLTGTRITQRLEGAAARIAQHEADHLDGVMHFDRVAEADRAALLDRYGARGGAAHGGA